MEESPILETGGVDMILFVSGLVIFFVGLWQHALGMVVIGAGVWCMASIDMIGDAVLRSWFSRLVYLFKFFYTRYTLWRDASAIEQAKSFCEAYSRAYKEYTFAPFRLVQDHHLLFATRFADRFISFNKESIPQSIVDLGQVLFEQGIEFHDLRNLWLLVNQEIVKNERSRLFQNVFCAESGKMDSDLGQIFVRFAKQNTPFSRLVFFEMILEDYTVSFIAQYFRLANHRFSWFIPSWKILDNAIRVASMDHLACVRQTELKRTLNMLRQEITLDVVDLHEREEGLVNNYIPILNEK